jgi:D-arabinono-1,4-lactone oxidase
MFLGEWHCRNLPLVAPSDHENQLPLVERENERRKVDISGAGDGLEWIGERRWKTQHHSEEDRMSELPPDHSAPSPPTTATSEESFDLLAKGEASILLHGA